VSCNVLSGKFSAVTSEDYKCLLLCFQVSDVYYIFMTVNRCCNVMRLFAFISVLLVCEPSRMMLSVAVR